MSYTSMKMQLMIACNLYERCYWQCFFSILGLCAKDLKRGFFGKPNPYVRMCIVPRFRGLAVIQKYHGQQVKTIAQNNTVNPSWKNEVSLGFLHAFIFQVFGSFAFPFISLWGALASPTFVLSSIIAKFIWNYLVIS